jgi:hypothetical protein
MSRFRFLAFLLLPVLTGSTLSLLAARGQQAPQSTKTAPPAQPIQPPSSKPPAPAQSTSPPASKPGAPAQPAPSKADPAAGKTIKQAIEQLDPARLGWLETTLWQQADSQGISFQAEGRYLSAPPHLVRLDMKIDLAGGRGESLLVSNGKTVWNSTKIGGEDPIVTKFDLKKVEDVLNGPGTLPQVKEEFYRIQVMQGLVPLLQTLSRQMIFTKQESARWQGRDVLKLTGEWTPEITRTLTQQPSAWPPLFPRTCRLYLGRLGGTTLWPYRIEWWGPASPGNPDVLLFQMEFRDPKILKPGEKPPKPVAEAFAFLPGKKEPVDTTNAMVESAVQARSRRQAPQQNPGFRPPP